MKKNFWKIKQFSGKRLSENVHSRIELNLIKPRNRNPTTALHGICDAHNVASSRQWLEMLKCFRTQPKLSEFIISSAFKKYHRYETTKCQTLKVCEFRSIPKHFELHQSVGGKKDSE